MVQHGRVLQGRGRRIRQRGPRRGDWSRHHQLGLLHVQGVPHQYHQLHPVAFRGIQLPESSELGRPQHDIQQRGVRHDQLDSHRDAPVAVRVEAGLLTLEIVVSKKHVVFSCVVLLVLGVGSSAQVRTPDQTLINPDSKDWVTYGGTYNSHRYSQLKQVTTANASRLQAKWVYHLAGMDELEPTPIVLNGVMYISGFNRVDAIDARSGNIIWRYQRQPASSTRQRGTAIFGDKVYVATSDSHLVALDARVGGVRWDVKSESGYTIAGGAAFVADGKVLVTGNRTCGLIQAHAAETGKPLWTWSALPKPGEQAYKTWG